MRSLQTHYIKGCKMAIARAQLMKNSLPGLNALFGMEYARYLKSGGML